MTQGFMGKPALKTPRPLSVSEVNQKARDLLERTFPQVWVEGEVSRPTRAGSGHLYFGLKDGGGRLEAVVWASQAYQVRCPLTDGLKVTVVGVLTIYPPTGRYQIVCQSVQPVGEGALRAAFLELKGKLDAEGLTAPERRRALPFLPRAVGVVTSSAGAAIHDLTQVIWRRFPKMPVIFCPVRVQGRGAAREIIRGLSKIQQLPEVDVVIVGRGGGSQEDLWTFNEELLVRALAACRVPTVSAVGHEIDVTLCDLVADRRALTPTEAGELVVPLWDELVAELGRFGGRLNAGVRRVAQGARSHVEGLGRRPGLRMFPARIENERQHLDVLEGRLRRGVRGLLADMRTRLELLARALSGRSPSGWVHDQRARVLSLGVRLDRGALHAVREGSRTLEPLARALDTLNPVAVLRRGFSVTRVERFGRSVVLRESTEVRVGDVLLTTLRAGDELHSEVTEITPRTLPTVELPDEPRAESTC